MKPMVPSARERIDATYEAWDNLDDLTKPDIEVLHEEAMEQAHRDGHAVGFAAALDMLREPSADVLDAMRTPIRTDVVPWGDRALAEALRAAASALAEKEGGDAQE